MPPYEDKGIYSGEDLAKLILNYAKLQNHLAYDVH
jgi:hypothetical protein